MNFFSKLLIVIGIVFSLIFIKDTFFADQKEPINISFKKFERKQENKKTLTKKIESKKEKNIMPVTKKESNVVGIYFTDKNDGEIKCLYKLLPQNTNKLNFAIKTLLAGPSIIETPQGYSSEIPKGTRLIELKETPKAYFINLSNDFQYGGGTESQYLRLKQLIKTVVNLKLDKPVFLYLNGKKAEVIGGEGILISQPLSESSLDE